MDLEFIFTEMKINHCKCSIILQMVHKIVVIAVCRIMAEARHLWTLRLMSKVSLVTLLTIAQLSSPRLTISHLIWQIVAVSPHYLVTLLPCSAPPCCSHLHQSCRYTSQGHCRISHNMLSYSPAWED